MEVKPALEGFIEHMSPSKLEGWVWSKSEDRSLHVDILVAGKVLGSTIADRYRKDLAETGKGNGKHAFSFKFPSEVKDYYVNGRVQVLVQGESTALPMTAELIRALHSVAALLGREGDNPGPRLMPTMPKLAEPGLAEVAPSDASLSTGATGQNASITLSSDGDELVGWAALPGSETAVLVTVDGRVLKRTSATGLASSVDPKLASRGFAVPVPAELRTGVDRRVLLHSASSGVLLREVKLRFSPVAVSAPPTAVLASVRDTNQALDKSSAHTLPVRASEPAEQGAVEQLGQTPRKRLVVVAWDMAHNPVGRAYLVADLAAYGWDVELVGPLTKQYGTEIWKPISEAGDMAIQTFPVGDLDSLVEGALGLASKIKCDAVIVCKPRLPSLLIGALIRSKNNCPMILDIDDHELSFVKDRGPIDFSELISLLADDPVQATTAHSDVWTRFAETLISEADGRIVSNVALQRKFGGIIVRHARNEKVFVPGEFDRRAVRESYGYGDTDRVILFLGTPRPHKGIFDVAERLDRLADDRLALCVIGTINDKRVLNRFSSFKRARIALHPDQPWSRLPELVAMADSVAILQDPKHPISEFQIPAKLTDALALNVPVLMTPVPPVQDLIFSGAFEVISNTSQLDDALRKLATQPGGPQPNGQGRNLYLTEFSYAVNRARLDLAVHEANISRVTDLPRFEKLFQLLTQRTKQKLPAPLPRRSGRAKTHISSPPDLVFLWKQNDSDIYGRRSDMLAKYLLQTGRVRRVLHIDAPISGADLERQATSAQGESAHQGNLIYLNTVRRVLRMADTPNFARRTFLHRSGSKVERAIGMELPARDGYSDFIRQVLADVGINERPILWVCPIVFDYQSVASVVRPGHIIADLIDDQRTFPGSSEDYRQRVRSAYDVVLNDADAVFCNCEPVRAAFSALRSDIRVVPNGSEIYPDLASWAKPVEMAAFSRPVIGYVGNLRDRVDFDLIEAVAERYPDGTVVLVGSAHGRPEIAQRLARWPNIKMLGVRPYEEAQRLIRSFDVAMMPHLKTEQSDRMNPLKLYVYFALDVPVVTTDVANIGDLLESVSVADGKDAFLEAIGSALVGKGKLIEPGRRDEILKALSWERRVSDIWKVVEALP